MLSTEIETYKIKVVNLVSFMDLTEDYSPGDSLLDIAEGLLQRGKGGVSVYMILAKWVCAIILYIRRRLLLIMRNRCLC